MSSEAAIAPHFGGAFKDGFLEILRARLKQPEPKSAAFVLQPELPSFGSAAKGQQLLAGNFQFGGHLMSAPYGSVWRIRAPDACFEAELHGFRWLNDLAALGTCDARAMAHRAIDDWIILHQRSQMPPWSVDLTGCRMIHWINNALFIMRGQTAAQGDAYFQSLVDQTIFIGRNWASASRGLPRFEALTGLLYAGLSLEGMDHHIRPAMNALARECAAQIGADGGLPSRNPEELLQVYTLLGWAEKALLEAGRKPLAPHRDALGRIAPSLRSLRHLNGALARFHGGGQGMKAQLDDVLVDVPDAPDIDHPMGYTRLICGSASVIMDTAAPSTRKASRSAHASTLAFELTAGVHPLVVNCGSGLPFGLGWNRIGRMTRSHSTLSVVDKCSADINDDPAGACLIKAARSVTAQTNADDAGKHIIASHDAYVPDYGLTHVRRLDLRHAGDSVAGEDTFAALSKADHLRFERYMNENALKGVPYDIRFHLHPDVDANLDLNGTAVSLVLKDGTTWVFQSSEPSRIGLEPSIYLETGRIKPRETKQIVVSMHMMAYASQVRWSLTRI